VKISRFKKVVYRPINLLLTAFKMVLIVFDYGRRKIGKLMQWSSQIEFGSGKIQMFFIIMLFALVLGGQTMSIKGPFDNLDIAISHVVILIALITGHFKSDVFANDSQKLVPLIAISLPIIPIYCFFAVGFEMNQIPPKYLQIFGYLSLGIVSIWAGIISGKMKSPPWMGNLLFKQHVLPKMRKRGIKLLHWSKEGKLSIIDFSEIDMQWIAGREMVEINHIPLSDFSPISIDESRGLVTPANVKLMEICSGFPAFWSESMSRHLELLKQGHERACWLNVLQIIIPKSPKTLSFERNLLKTISNIWEIDDELKKISWPLPDDFQLKQNYYSNKSTLCHFLDMDQDEGNVREIERYIVNSIFPRLSSSGRLDSSVNLLRSFSNFIIVLRGDMETSYGSRKEQCRRSIVELSQWFISLNLQENLFPEDQRNSFFAFQEDWSVWVDDSLEQPATVFLRLHDMLSLEITEGGRDENLDMKQAIAGLINDCTRKVIDSVAFTPISSLNLSENIAKNFTSEVSGNRRISMIVGIWKMLLLLSVLRTKEEIVF
jgi:hypothetical protein